MLARHRAGNRCAAESASAAGSAFGPRRVGRGPRQCRARVDLPRLFPSEFPDSAPRVGGAERRAPLPARPRTPRPREWVGVGRVYRPGALGPPAPPDLPPPSSSGRGVSDASAGAAPRRGRLHERRRRGRRLPLGHALQERLRAEGAVHGGSRLLSLLNSFLSRPFIAPSSPRPRRRSLRVFLRGESAGGGGGLGEEAAGRRRGGGGTAQLERRSTRRETGKARGDGEGGGGGREDEQKTKCVLPLFRVKRAGVLFHLYSSVM